MPLYSPLNDKGDTYRIQGNFAGNIVNEKLNECKWTFATLFEKGFLPFTAPELCGKATVDKSEVALYSGEETFTADKIKASELKDLTVKSNFVISDIHFIVIDGAGNEVFSAMYAKLGNDILSLKSYSVESALVDNDIYQNKDHINANVKKYAEKGDHTLKITARVSTGELLTVFKGALTE